MALLTISEQQGIKPISPNWASFIKITGGRNNFVQLQEEVEEKELLIIVTKIVFKEQVMQGIIKITQTTE